MQEGLKSFYLVECLAVVCLLTFVETTTIIHRSGFENNPVKLHSISANNALTLPRKLSVKESRKKRRLPDNVFHGRRKVVNHYSNKRHEKSGDGMSSEYAAGLHKRDYFFGPYGLMANPVDRRMFLIHRGERGPCSFHSCHHGGVCVPRRHGFYCECIPGFMGPRCEVKKECKPTTCKNGGTCTEISIARHLCTCPVGYRGDNCEERSYCHPNPCLNGGTCSQTDESYTCVCQEGYKGKKCEAVNKCSPNPCKNAGVCFELNNDYICNCPQGFKGKTCEVISECNSVYCLNGGSCRDETTGYHCDCRFGYYGKRCEVQTRLLWKEV